MQKNGLVSEIQDVKQADIQINVGFFIFKKEIFKYINQGEDLVCEPFQRLIKIKELVAYKHNGFWARMYTFKEQQQLDDMYTQGKAPWEVWRFPDKVTETLTYSPIIRNPQY